MPYDPGTAGVIAPKFRTYDALALSLAARVAGSRAALYGPTDAIGIFATDGSGNFSLDGVLDFTACDGSEFTLGLTGAANIEGLDGVAPTLDSSGLNVSTIEGGARLNFLVTAGFLSAAQALVDCSIPNVLDGQVIAIGTKDVYGGVGYVAAEPGWFRQTYATDPPALVTSAFSKEVSKPDGDQLIFTQIAQGSTVSTKANIQGGAVNASDPTASLLQASLTNRAGVDFANPRNVTIFCKGLAAAGFSAVVKSISASGGLA